MLIASVIMLIDPVARANAPLSTQCPGRNTSQFLANGTQSNIMTMNTATMVNTLTVPMPHTTRRTKLLTPEKRMMKIRTDNLTNETIGLYITPMI